MGGPRKRSIRRRISAKSARGTTTSASWKTTYRPCRTIRAPIFTSFSRKVVSDHCSTSCGKVCAEGVHPERLRKLAREGGRFTAQHLRALSPLRRQATLVATVLDTSTRLIDEGIALFDRAVARMFRRAETRSESFRPAQRPCGQ